MTNNRQSSVEQRVRMIYFQTEDGNIYSTDSRFVLSGPPVKKEESDRRALLGTFENMMIEAGISPSQGKVVPSPMVTHQLGEGTPSQLSIMSILSEDIMKMKSYINTMATRNSKLAGLINTIHPASVHASNTRQNILTTSVDPMISYPTEPGEILLLAIQEADNKFRHTQSKVTAVFAHKISRSRSVNTSSHSGANPVELQKKAFLDNSLHSFVNDNAERTNITFRDILSDVTTTAIAIVAQDAKNPDYVYLENENVSFDIKDIGTKAVVVPFSIADQAADELQSYHGVNIPFGTDTSFIDGEWVKTGDNANFNPNNLLTNFLKLNVSEDKSSLTVERKLDLRDDDIAVKISPYLQSEFQSVPFENISLGQLIGLLVIYPNGRAVIRVGDITVLKKGVK